MTVTRRHSRLKRLAARCAFRIAKIPIGLVALVNHRWYMRLYLPLLRCYGMQMRGTPRYIGVNTYFDDICLIELGHRVVISDGVVFLTHDYSVTTAMLAVGTVPKSDIALVRRISIGTNVFIGKGSIIMPNTRVGDNVVIGAGSVVRGRVQPNSVLLGNPAQVVFSIQEYAERCNRELENGAGRSD